MDITTLAMAKAYTDKNMDSVFDTVGVTEITWDGSPIGLNSFPFVDDNFAYYRISSLTPKMENIIGGTITTKNVGRPMEDTPVDSERIFKYDNFIEVNGLSIIIVYALGGEVNFPETGIWFLATKDFKGYVSKLTFGTPMEMRVLKNSTISPTPVFDLDENGISIQTLAMQGGGVADVDASTIFNKIERGKNYLFRAALGENTLEFPAAFYQYNNASGLENLGFTFSGFLPNVGFVQGNAVLYRDTVEVVLTPLGM